MTNTPGVLTDCTADIAMSLLLSVARRTGEGERQLRAGEWKGWCPTHMIGAKVTGKTIGIIGMGRIGKAMARRAHFGFGMKVIFFNRSRVDDEETRALGAVQLLSIEDVLEQADFVSLHCPGGAENRSLINADRLARMKKARSSSTRRAATWWMKTRLPMRWSVMRSPAPGSTCLRKNPRFRSG